MDKLRYYWFSFKYSLISNYSKNKIFLILSLFFGFIGIGWTLISVYDYFFIKPNSENILKSFVSNYFVWIIMILLLVAIIIKRNRTKIKTRIKGTDIYIKIRYCDIFNQKGAMILASMDTFDTNTTNGLVNPSTLHGKLIEKYYKNKTDLLETEIKNSLELNNQELLETDNELRGNKDRYEIGSTAILRPEKKVIYFSALSKMTKNGTVEVRPENLVTFLSNIWVFISQFGDFTENLNIPVIGTGIKRLPSEFTNQDIIYEIINSFIIASKVGGFCKELQICLYHKDYKYYNLEKIEKYLDYLNEYERKF